MRCAIGFTPSAALVHAGSLWEEGGASPAGWSSQRPCPYGQNTQPTRHSRGPVLLVGINPPMSGFETLFASSVNGESFTSIGSLTTNSTTARSGLDSIGRFDLTSSRRA
ncbi:MAG: hypothetical protein ACI9R3_004511 [Verrucomicrobiales bacterium]|jgi:hypothetical protein